MFSCAGIDVCKDSLEVRIIPQDVSANYPNNPSGFDGLIGWLSSLNVARVLLEATGGYERAAMKAIQKGGFEVFRVNPRRAKDFAKAMGYRAKTDPIDARLLAEFATVIKDSVSRFTCADQDELRALVQQRENFVQQQSDDSRRMKTAAVESMKPLLKSHIDYLTKAIKSIEKLISQCAKKLDSEKVRRLCSVKGIGLTTAASIMAYLPELGEVGRRQIAALAGIAPYNEDSGQHEGPRHISGGRFAARRAMYMACWTIILRQPEFKARYEALRLRGKRPKVALIACMRVLLIRLNAMIRDKTEWGKQAA